MRVTGAWVGIKLSPLFSPASKKITSLPQGSFHKNNGGMHNPKHVGFSSPPTSCFSRRLIFGWCIPFLIQLGGLNRSRIDRNHCGICGKTFGYNESKMMYHNEDFFVCNRCDEARRKKNERQL